MLASQYLDTGIGQCMNVYAAVCFSRFYLSAILNYYMTDDYRDEMDINRQCHKLYAQQNMLIRKFHMCTADVKVELFRTFCTPLYAVQIWWNYRLFSIRKLNVSYNDIMRLLLCLPRHHSASQLFANIGVPAFQAVLRNLVFKFIT